MLFGGLGLGLLTILCIIYCFLPMAEVNKWARWLCFACYSFCKDVYSDKFAQGEGLDHQLEGGEAADGLPGKPGPRSRGNEWSAVVGKDKSAYGKVAAEHAALRAQAVDKLHAELAGALSEAEESRSSIAEAEARRAALLAEAAHVSDEMASLVEAVMGEAAKVAEEAKWRGDHATSQHIDFMARTMRSCGSAALEPTASAEQRGCASDMAKFCSQAMVNHAHSRARRATRRAEGLESVLKTCKQAAAEEERSVSGCSPYTPQPTFTSRASPQQDEQMAATQQSVLDQTQEALWTLCGNGALTGSPIREDREGRRASRSSAYSYSRSPTTRSPPSAAYRPRMPPQQVTSAGLPQKLREADLPFDIEDASPVRGHQQQHRHHHSRGNRSRGGSVRRPPSRGYS